MFSKLNPFNTEQSPRSRNIDFAQPHQKQQDTQLYSMDQAIDIAQKGIECKKNKMYKLAKTYLITAAEMMLKVMKCTRSFIQYVPHP